MPSWCLRVYLSVTAACATLYFALPEPPRALWTVIGALSIVATVVGIRVNRPARTLPWWLVAAGLTAFVAGDTAYDVLTGPMGLENPFPSVVDVLYLCTYPLFAAGLLLIVRARGGPADRSALLDAVIVTIGLGLPIWVFVAAPYAVDTSLTVLERAVSLAYPLGDLLLLAVLARLVVGGGAGSTALRLLVLGTTGLLVSDVLYGLTQLHGSWETGGPVDLGWMVFYVAWGAAALQPDMVRLAAPLPQQEWSVSRVRLALLGTASLIPPAVLLLGALDGEARDVVVNALASATIFVLVVCRLSGLVEVARQSTAREAVLRRTGELLVGASGRDEILQVTASAISTMGAQGPRRVLVALGPEEAPRLVLDSAASAVPDPTQPVDDLHDLLVRHRAALDQHGFVLTTADLAGAVVAQRLGPGAPVLLVALSRGGRRPGVVAVTGEGVDRTEVIETVCAICAQCALALESADLTEQVLQRKSEQHFRSLIHNTSDIIVVVDADLRVGYRTPSMSSLLGRQADEVIGRPVLDLLHGADVPRASLLLHRVAKSVPDEALSRREPDDHWRLTDQAGDLRTFEVTCRNLLDDPFVSGIVLTLHDITERQALEADLKHMAFHDSLTQLPNRALFLDRVGQALARQGRHRERLAVMLIDLDDFKLVNDTRGHAAGDVLLVMVAQRIRETVRPEDTCARLGGDEFAVLVEGLVDDGEASQLAARIVAATSLPFDLGDGQPVAVRSSIGLSTSDYGSDPAELLLQADLAMYAAKDAGKGTYRPFQPALQEAVQTQLSMGRELQTAFEQNQFVLYYQPVVDLGTGRVMGTEALLRWRHPSQGLLLPGEFIELVESGELAVPVGAWVVEQAIAQAVAWQPFSSSAPALTMSVNVCSRQLADPGFVALVAESLRRHGLAPHALTLEITERLLTSQDPQIGATMAGLDDLGVGLAIDDFGTGYASLGFLRRFPVTTLKIGRSFVGGVDRDEEDRALVEAIVRLGETFGLELVAEGIETESQQAALVAIGCRLGQGFRFAPALSARDASAHIAISSAIPPSTAPPVLHPLEGEALT